MRQTNLTARYEQLLAERITLGRLYVDTVSHGAPFEDAARLYAQATRLDRQLDRYRRYTCDEYRVVAFAEDDRWHVPGEPPAGSPECRLCIKQQLDVPLSLVLPPSRESDRRPTIGEVA